MPDKSTPIDPQLYRETIGLFHLKAVHLHELKTSCHNRVVGDVKINISTHADPSQENDEFQINTHYKVAASNAKVDLFTIEMIFTVLFSAPEELPDGFVAAFISNNLNVTVFPYVRELVASMTARMGLPALTLPYILNQYEETSTKPKARTRKKKVAE